MSQVTKSLICFIWASQGNGMKLPNGVSDEISEVVANPMEIFAALLLLTNSVDTFSLRGQFAARSLGVALKDQARERSSTQRNQRCSHTVNSVGRRDAMKFAGVAATAGALPNAATASIVQQLVSVDAVEVLQARSIGEAVISGGSLPLTVGFGTCLIPPSETENLVRLALQVGYRLIDTAQRYGNEAGVGRALKKAISSGELARQDVFVTTKVWIDNMGYSSTVECVRESALKLGSLEGGIDLVLIHWPGRFVRRGDPGADKLNMKLRRETWNALEKLQSDGVVKHIGVSNFGERHLKELLSYANVKPWVNQFEVHPYLQRQDLVKLCQNAGIAVNAYSPLGGKGNSGQLTDELLSDPVLKRIGATHRKTSAEIILRWHLQRGITPIPKSSSKARMQENYNIFDFELTREEMDAIAKFDRGQFVVFDGDNLA